MSQYQYGEIQVDVSDPDDDRPRGAPPDETGQYATPGATIKAFKPRPHANPVPAGYTVETLFRSYHRILMKFLRERLLDQSEAEDVAQEVYYRIARRPDLEKLAYPKAFLMRTAKNLLIDMNRCRLTRQADIPLEPDMLDQQPDTRQDTPETRLMNEEALRILENTLARLSPKCQAVFVMNRMDGIPYRQIAVELNLSQSMVEKYMRQALKCLKASLEAPNG